MTFYLRTERERVPITYEVQHLTQDGVHYTTYHIVILNNRFFRSSRLERIAERIKELDKC